MPSNLPLSKSQRWALSIALQAKLALLQQDSTSHLEGMSQTEHAQQTLLQDADDATQLVGEHEIEAKMSDINSEELNAVSNALERIHGEGYGLCADCQMRIPLERLTVEPQALRCVACETLHERKM